MNAHFLHPQVELTSPQSVKMVRMWTRQYSGYSWRWTDIVARVGDTDVQPLWEASPETEFQVMISIKCL